MLRLTPGACRLISHHHPGAGKSPRMFALLPITFFESAEIIPGIRARSERGEGKGSWPRGDLERLQCRVTRKLGLRDLRRKTCENPLEKLRRKTTRGAALSLYLENRPDGSRGAPGHRGANGRVSLCQVMGSVGRAVFL